jgi:hypothetical protein
MSIPVTSELKAPTTFPYRPSGGFRPSEIWGGNAPDHDDVPSGMTSETKDRLKKIGFEALEDLFDVLRQRALPQDPLEKEPRPNERDVLASGNLPVIPIQGRARQISNAGMIGLAVLGAGLFIALLKDRRAMGS